MMKNNHPNALQDHARDIFQAGLDRVNSHQLLLQVLRLEENILVIKTETEELKIDLSQFKKIKLIGFGKAAAQMAAGLCSVLSSHITEGVIVVKDITTAKLPDGVEVLIGSHPIPSSKSELAGKRLLEFCNSCIEGELILGVISGGASALMESPASGLTLDDLQKTTQLLMECGATIQEINCIRKHLSDIKGGRLAEAISPAVSLNFILSDVVGDDLTVIGSGPTVADQTTFADAWKLIEKYNLNDKLPTSIVKHLKVAQNETPKILSRTKNILVGTNRQALIAARNKARDLGYETIIVSDQIQGEASLVASRLFDLARSPEIAKMKKPLCLLAGGETTVTIRGNGKGGRNQEMALAYLCRLQEEKITRELQIFLSASTDGGDGPTDSAGAFASSEILKKAQTLNIDPEAFLAKNDSYHFFEKVNAHLKTGNTETNVCDLQILLINK